MTKIVTFCLLCITSSKVMAQLQTTQEKQDSLQGNLTEVVISAERSDLKVENGRIGYDLNRIARQYTVDNVWEALARLPGIIEKEGAYQLAGSPVTIILNGRPTTMTAAQLETLLKNTPVNRVQKVEVMHSAPPQYHVRGAALNVILKQSRKSEIQGEVHGDYTNRFFSYGSLGGNVRVSSPKVTLDLMYDATRRKNIQTVELYSRHTLTDKVYDINQYQEIRQKRWVHDLRTALDWHISRKDNFSLAYTGSYTPSYTRNSITKGNFQNGLVDGNGDGTMHNLSLAYTSGFGLQVGGDYTYYKTSGNQFLNTDYTDGSRMSLQVNDGQRIDRYKVYADQSFDLKRKWTFGFGGSYTYAYDKDYQIYNKVEGGIATQNTQSALKEHTTDFYVSIGKSYESGTSFSVSATGESYKIGDYQRWAIYPQASMTYVLSPRHIFQLELSTDKDYPSYWNMQSSVTYLDGYSEIWGTPGLRPSKAYDVTASYIFRQKYVFALFFSRENDYFQQAAYQSTDRLALIYQYLNWNYSQRAGIQIVLPFTVTKWYNIRATFVGAQMHERADYFHDISFNRRKWLGIVTCSNSFNAGKHLVFNIDGMLQSPAIQGTYDINSLFRLSASAKYTFAGGKASVSLKCNDIFNTGVAKTKVRLGTQYMDQRANKYSRLFNIHFSYRFGGYKGKDVKKVDTSRFGH